MNTSFFKSWYAVVALLVIASFAAWLLAAGIVPGNRPGGDRSFLLASGCVAFALMVCVTLYTLRKRLYQLRLSPETRNRIPHSKLEHAESLLNELRGKILQGAVSDKGDVTRLARNAMREAGVARIARTVVEKGREGEPPFVIHVFPTEPLGRVAKWLHAHLYLGIAFGAMVWFHGGGSLSSPMAATMTFLSAVVVVTGLAGVFLFALGPGWITAREQDLSLEKAFVLEASLGRELAVARKALDERAHGLVRKLDATSRRFRKSCFEALQAFGTEDRDGRKKMEEYLILLSQKERVGNVLSSLSRVKFWINAWRVVHIPASIVLFGVVVIHVWTVWRY